MDQRLDHILTVLMETNEAICEQHQEENFHLKYNFISLERENTTIKHELGAVKESTNRSELASRYCTSK